MQAQEYFFGLLNASPHTSVKKDIMHSGKFLSPQIRLSLKNYYKTATEMKFKGMIKDHSDQNLGPGRYYTPTPPITPAFKFSKTPRFKKDNDSPINVSMSTGHLSSKSPVPEVQKSQIIISAYKKKLVKNYNIEQAIKKQTKEILEDRRKQKILKSLKEKEERTEYRKNAKLKDPICKFFTSLIVFLTIPWIYNRKYHDLKNHKDRICQFLIFLKNLSRALGKFRLNGKRQRVKSSWGLLRKHLPFFINNWKIKKYFDMNSIMSDLFSRFYNQKAFTLYYFLLKNKITLLQKNIKNFAACTMARRQGLELMWTYLNTRLPVVPDEVKDYFISKYIKEKLLEKYYAANKEKKILMLLNENRHEEYLDNIMNFDQKVPPLKIFSRRDVLELINSAYLARAQWNKYTKITLLASQHTEEDLKPKKKKKKRRTMPKKKKRLLFSDQASQNKILSLQSKKLKALETQLNKPSIK